MNRNMYGKLFAIIMLICSITSCRKPVPVPTPPDYTDSTQWYIIDRKADADLFYIISTETGDYNVSKKVVRHYADTYDERLRTPMRGEMEGVAKLLSGNLNYFSPYYRQCTMESFTADSLVNERIPLAMEDVRKAFDHYMKHLNNGRPFILAGFSQGAIAVVELLKHMDAESRSRMVAAYVIGWKVTGEDIAAAPQIRAAQDSADIGVTICYNTVRANGDAIPLISEGNIMAINPVSWSTSGEPARMVSPLSGDTLTLTLDTLSRLLILDGYTGNDYMLPLIGREGNYHRLEISLYSDCLRRNMALRARRHHSLSDTINSKHDNN